VNADAMSVCPSVVTESRSRKVLLTMISGSHFCIHVRNNYFGKIYTVRFWLDTGKIAEKDRGSPKAAPQT
jgi:hypothetical protein